MMIHPNVKLNQADLVSVIQQSCKLAQIPMAAFKIDHISAIRDSGGDWRVEFQITPLEPTVAEEQKDVVQEALDSVVPMNPTTN